jgi:hypothetical protein
MNEKLVPSDARAVSLESHVKQRREREREQLSYSYVVPHPMV